MTAVQAFIAANRFGLGPQPGQMKALEADPVGWVKSQIQSASGAEQPAGAFPSTLELVRQVQDLRKNKGELKKEYREEAQKTYKDEMEARFRLALSTEVPLLERLTLFWSNHFTVSGNGKFFVAPLAGAFEREAIRPHILGRFEDMLLASARHPAMLLYLDNATSVGPNSIAGRRSGKGLNENLAREMMELHSLGVDGGYSQDDVIALAKIITGWTLLPAAGKPLLRRIGNQEGRGGFSYIDLVHEPGAHVLLGKSYAQNGEQQGIDAIRDLAAHPATARHIATKLARHFISDAPTPESIAVLERSFRDSGGDLKAVTATLADLPDAWEHPLAKVKTPYEMVVSTLRLFPELGLNMPFHGVFKSLALLEQVPFQATSPAGWPDTAADWISPNGLISRIEWCHTVAQKLPRRTDVKALIADTIGPVANAETVAWIERAPDERDGLALLLASPEFQRR